MAVVKLLRVVNKFGKGMYRSYDCGDNYESLAYRTWNKYAESNKHPAPWEDSDKLNNWWEKHREQNCYFGFASEYQFKQWIYEEDWRIKMNELGGKLLVISIDSFDCCSGNYQAIYLHDKVIAVREFPTTAFDHEDTAKTINDYLLEG